ncbi:Lipopolysaccharide biosynthesis protein WzxC [Crateriforma conspicua]|uniref:Lipopolysaccharide biosynthesis protein WzxC n=2 Tax=Crateriforma conspicua TaxID=2527996 RepID=A0A5C6FVH4_9PLAN|nr:Lipopolysaccharide biosynthesis protein WzxC [Crateriforma conspicua]
MPDAKSEMGVFALLMLIYSFASVLATGSLGSFAIWRQDLERAGKSTLYWLSLALGLTTSGILVLLCFPITAWLAIPAWRFGLMAMAISCIPLSWSGVATSILRKHHRFGTVLAVEIFRNASLIFISCSFLFAGFGVWGLILGVVIANLVAASSATLAEGGPSFEFSSAIAKDAFTYCKGLAGFNCVNYWSRNLDNLLVGKFYGDSVLGSYSIAYRMMVLPIRLAGTVFGGLLLPYLAPIQDDHIVLRKKLLQVVQATGLLIIPLMTLFWLERKHIIDWYLQPGWEDTIKILGILVPVGMSQLLISPLGICYQLSGRTTRLFWVGIFNSSVVAIGFVVGLLGDLHWFVVVYSVVNIILLYPTVHFSFSCVGGRFSEWLRSVLPFAAIPLCCYLIDYSFMHDQNMLTDMFASVILVACVSLLTTALWLKAPMRFILNQLMPYSKSRIA